MESQNWRHHHPTRCAALGCSRWTGEREYFTMDATRARSGHRSVVRLFEQGLIYRGKRGW